MSTPPITMRQTIVTDSYDDIVTFGHVLAATIFYGNEEPVKDLLHYFEKPWQWEREFQKWRELGGTLDEPCLDAFERWYDNRAMGIEVATEVLAKEK